MATHKVYAGDDWTFETTLTDSDGNAITSLDDAWFSIYSGQDDETAASYELSDAEMTLASNVLTTVVPAATTTDIDDGTYYLDVKVDVTSSATSTVTYKDRVRVINTSPLYDNY